MTPEESNANSIEHSDALENSETSFINVIITTFTTVFLAELGDKTQIATLLLSAQSGKPIVVFIGAASALVCSSLVGVFVGQWIANKIPQERFEYMAGALMIGLGLWIAFQSIHTLIFQELYN